MRHPTALACLLTVALLAGASVCVAVAQTAALLAPGTAAPDFSLQDTEGCRHQLGDYLAAGRIVVLEWFNPDCPFVIKHHQRYRTMTDLHARFAPHGVVWLAVNSSAPGKQGHGLERNQRAHQEYAMPYPVLLDPTGRVGQQYGARTSPHMFVISPGGTIVYNGAIDDNRSPTDLGETNHVAEALAAVLAGDPVAVAETRPYGCSVKYAQ